MACKTIAFRYRSDMPTCLNCSHDDTMVDLVPDGDLLVCESCPHAERREDDGPDSSLDDDTLPPRR